MNIPVRRNIVFDNDLFMPRSALRVDLPRCSWLARSPGTRQRWEPLRQPIPNEDRCDGHIVIFFRSGGEVKIDARARIKLTSESTSLIPMALIWPVMSLMHAWCEWNSGCIFNWASTPFVRTTGATNKSLERTIHRLKFSVTLSLLRFGLPIDFTSLTLTNKCQGQADNNGILCGWLGRMRRRLSARGVRWQYINFPRCCLKFYRNDFTQF